MSHYPYYPLEGATNPLFRGFAETRHSSGKRSRVSSTFLSVCTACTVRCVLRMYYFIGYDYCVSSTQLLLVDFDLGYNLSSESLQLLRIQSLYYNKQYYLRHYCPSSPPKISLRFRLQLLLLCFYSSLTVATHH